MINKKTRNGALVSTGDISRQLDSILASREFKNTPRLQKLLRYVVEKYIADECFKIKAYTIAVEAYGKPSDYDPTDPYIRNIARDIRKSLSVYYLNDGLNDQVRIEIPVGSYVPSIRMQNPDVQWSGVEKLDSETIPTVSNSGMKPVIAVIPPYPLLNVVSADPVGEIIADEIISGLSGCEELQVISRLSTTCFRAQQVSLEEIRSQLGADYVICGSYRSAGSTIHINIELVEVRSQSVLWGERMSADIDRMLQGTDTLVSLIIAETSRMIVGNELQRALHQSPQSLENYTLVIAGVRLMHRSSVQDFNKAKVLFQTLSERTSKLAIPHAQLAKWYVLSYTRGWSTESDFVAKKALECTSRALENDSHCTLALTVDGFVHTNIIKDLYSGEKRYRDALSVNPSDSLAWLLLGTLNAFKGNGEMAVAETDQAIRLSPLDPLRYFYESLAATAALSAQQYEKALTLANSSIALNQKHSSTLRALAIAHIMLGHELEARYAIAEMRKLDPTLTTQTFLERSPSGDFEIGKTWANALESAGLPK